MEMNDKITLIIPTMNRLESLLETLDGYIEGSYIPDQIIIVDQTQDEKLRTQIVNGLKTYKDRTKLCYIYQEKPSSTIARNNGLRLAENEILVFSDDDVTVGYETLKDVKRILLDKSISMIAGINSRDGFSTAKFPYLFGKKSYFKRDIGHVTKAMLGRFPEKKVSGMIETEWAMGFFFVVKKSLTNKWGIQWDENLTSYAFAEDLDFSYNYYKKSKNENLRCVLDERISVEHRVSTEWRVPSRESTMMYVINREYLAYKHQMGVFSLLLVRWCNVGDIFMRLLKRISPKDILDAQKICRIHRKEIANGKIEPEWYR